MGDDYLGFAEKLADAAATETLPRFRADVAVFNKAGAIYDPVTEADRAAEQAQRQLIAQAYPDHGIIGEEFGIQNGNAPYRWVLDPIDGTRAFVCGAPCWTTLIALERDDAAQIGVIDQPYLGERWLAADGKASFRRGEAVRACRVSGVTDLSKARLSTTDPRAEECFTPSQASRFMAVAQQARLVRFSMDAYAYGLLAIGELDLVIEAGLQHHDFAALCPIVEGAGGVITDWRGKKPGTDNDGSIIAAASPTLLNAVLPLLQD